MITCTFITGNDDKARELAEILGTQIKRQKIELEELQSIDLQKIVEHKLKQAFEHLKTPVLVEDVSLIFHALGNLPGPYIKWFNQEIGINNYPRLLTPFADKRITSICVYGFYDGTTMRFFEGRCEGTMADAPRGQGGFGFDVIFIPTGDSRTLAEMTPQEKHKISHRGRALAKLQSFFLDNQ